MGLLFLRLTLALYFTATLAAFVAILGRRRWWDRIVPALIGAGCIMHLAALVCRGIELGHCPLHTTGEIVSFLSLAGMLIFLFGFYRRGMQVLAVVLLPLSLVLAVISNLLPTQTLRLEGSSLDRLLTFHVAFSTLGVAALFLTLAASLIYLWQERALKQKSGASLLRLRLPALDTCDSLIYGTLVTGFLLMTLAIITGSLWKASTPDSTFWLWEKREILALLAWVIFGSLIAGRLLAGWRGRKAAYLVIVGVVAVLLRMLGLTP
jgi:ABC-type uncharacterized transport system permease subunit